MAEVIRMPKMSDTMEEGVIASWLVKEGDKVSSGDILAEVETDKATMELESYEDGTILHIGIEEGDAVPVNGVIAVIGEDGEDYKDLLEEETSNGDNGQDDNESSDDDSNEDASEDIDTSDINASVIKMPKMSDTMEEGTIASWLKKEGDKVSSGDILAEVETDKATMELEAYEDGTLLYIGIKEGDSVPVDGIIAVIGEEGADYKSLVKAEEQKNKGGDKTEKKEEKKEESSSKGSSAPKPASSANKGKSGGTQPTSSSSSNGRIFASPLAKKIAEDKGIDLAEVEGSGNNGRIVKADVENFTPSQKSTKLETASADGSSINIPKVVGEEHTEEVKLSQMRKAIGKTVSRSKFSAPHFYVTMEINMDKAIEARKSLNEVSPVKISFNDMVVKATAAALRQHPEINVSFSDDKVLKHDHINIGVAVAISEGLLIPVVKFADNKSLSHISAEIKDLGARAKDRKLEQEEMEGATFSISNLGMFGVEEFTAIINGPAACILAVGGIKQEPVVKDGEIKIGNTMKVTLSSDHRVVDGAMAAPFLVTLKNLLEDPVRILI
ncbi:pyruvate dehydrogenase complex dihydrolipoamide acetyltransferase [Marivirga atlantica]|jgi:pyruvate dehydrogenase E2 component (dihydrolipoamide acetyltransferase)|uniref:Acetyltransferase component of pyruvate dehydrogenase complex n=1 Tax=Marivirga atlantica TaxID=1548457 RepID=A0A937DL90_9BACT|nr:pyruvate dehydrogenase complex dihydrolipoamide acetyltransferase [Marivirga atlantica]MBL0767031.1 pyruvate dehydrogenase complex dihydrolipoamide acetyltransferase [Marivirga atlantica]